MDTTRNGDVAKISGGSRAGNEEQGPFLTVLVPTIDRRSDLSFLLSKLKSEDPSVLQIIVSDNCSEDPWYTHELPKICESHTPKITLRRTVTRVGVEEHFKSLLDLVETDYVVFCADDDFWDDGSLTSLALECRAKNADWGFCGEWSYFEVSDPDRKTTSTMSFPLRGAECSVESVTDFWKFSNDPHFYSVFRTSYLLRLWPTIAKPFRVVGKDNHYLKVLPFVLALAIDNSTPALIDTGWHNGLRTGMQVVRTKKSPQELLRVVSNQVVIFLRHYLVVSQSLLRGLTWAKRQGPLSLELVFVVVKGMWRFPPPPLVVLIKKRFLKSQRTERLPNS